MGCQQLAIRKGESEKEVLEKIGKSEKEDFIGRV